MERFINALKEPNGFAVTCELIPGRGFKSKNVDRIYAFMEEAAEHGGVDALSLTDNAGGNPALTADVLGAEIVSRGIDAIIHFTCKDMNRNFIESRAYSLQRSGIKHLLVMTGDYPVSGFLGLPKPSFDIDSISALQYLREMNRGLCIGSGKTETFLEKTDFFLGAVVSPFKYQESMNLSQYVKMEKKLFSGAEYIITQVGFDSLKLKEALLYLRNFLGEETPLIGSVYLLSRGAAEVMHRGEIPGCYVSRELLDILRKESESADRGKQARLERGAEQFAILKGLGFNGAHIEGARLSYGDVQHVVERGTELAAHWEELYARIHYPPENPFYLFDTSFLKEGAMTAAPAVLGKTDFRLGKKPPVRNIFFWGTRLIHRMFFTQNTLGFMLVKEILFRIRNKKGLVKLLTFFEKMVKKPMFDCRECDDCTLFETYYICPESKCPKAMRIGPCGGTRIDASCEVFPDQDCIWHTIYLRAKNRDETGKLRYIIPPRDWGLYKTNSWINYFLRLDHSGKVRFLPKEPEREKRGKGEKRDTVCNDCRPRG